MSSSLPRSTPGDQRVDLAAVLSFLDAVDERPGVEMHSLMVVRRHPPLTPSKLQHLHCPG
jgi:hypothetical protein